MTQIIFLGDSAALERIVDLSGTTWVRVLGRGEAISQCTRPLGLDTFVGIELGLGGVPSQ